MNFQEYICHPSAIWSAMPAEEIPGTLPITQELQIALLKARCVLDIGCGCGNLASEVQRAPTSHWFGVDVNSAAIARASKRSIPSAEFFVHDFLCPLLTSADFDLIILNAVLTCLPRSDQRLTILQNVARLLSRHQAVVYVADFLETWTEPSHAVRYKKGAELGLEPGSFPVEGDSGNLLYIAHHFKEREFQSFVENSRLRISSYSEAQGVTRSGKAILTFRALIQ